MLLQLVIPYLVIVSCKPFSLNGPTLEEVSLIANNMPKVRENIMYVYYHTTTSN